MDILINWLLSTVVILVGAYIIPGVVVSSFVAALFAALVIGIINAFIRPIILLLTLPINILTLGLFTLVINALLIMLAAAIAPGFSVDGFLAALLFSIALFILNIIVEALFKK
ncbi:MAG: phage holin family protein [bacterium]|nr:phage holin family protein [bacterium]